MSRSLRRLKRRGNNIELKVQEVHTFWEILLRSRTTFELNIGNDQWKLVEGV